MHILHQEMCSCVLPHSDCPTWIGGKHNSNMSTSPMKVHYKSFMYAGRVELRQKFRSTDFT